MASISASLTAACGLVLLQTAQERGNGKCCCFVIDDDAAFDHGVKWLAVHALITRSSEPYALPVAVGSWTGGF